MSLNLTPAELRDYTGHIRSDAQARELDHLGIPYKPRRDGTLVVLRRDVEGVAGTIRPTEHEAEPELMP